MYIESIQNEFYSILQSQDENKDVLYKSLDNQVLTAIENLEKSFLQRKDCSRFLKWEHSDLIQMSSYIKEELRTLEV